MGQKTKGTLGVEPRTCRIAAGCSTTELYPQSDQINSSFSESRTSVGVGSNPISTQSFLYLQVDCSKSVTGQSLTGSVALSCNPAPGRSSYGMV